jgi:predicted NBD/HSP70 family sugar kinase
MLGVRTAALPTSLRRTNQRTVVSLLQRLGSASRADLAKAAGLSQPTAGKIITALLRLGILQQPSASASDDLQGADAAPRLGRPGQLLQLDQRRCRFIAIELGVTETCVSALPVAARLTDDWAFTFVTPETPQAWVQELKAVAAKLGTHQLWGILISVPGIVDEAAGRVVLSPNLHWLEKVGLPQLVGQVWRLPVVLVQEIRALALGHLAATPAGGNFFLVDFGVGVGGAVVRAGKLYASALPSSGEIGHAPVTGNTRPCGCGATGCLETLASERGLLESFGTAHGIAKPSWPMLSAHVQQHGIEPWLAQTLDTTAKAMAGALNVLGLDRIVMTGRLVELPGGVFESLSTALRQATLWARFGDVSCERAPHHRAAGLVLNGMDRLVLPAEPREDLILSHSI